MPLVYTPTETAKTEKNTKFDDRSRFPQTAIPSPVRRRRKTHEDASLYDSWRYLEPLLSTASWRTFNLGAFLSTSPKLMRSERDTTVSRKKRQRLWSFRNFDGVTTKHDQTSRESREEILQRSLAGACQKESASEQFVLSKISTTSRSAWSFLRKDACTSTSSPRGRHPSANSD